MSEETLNQNDGQMTPDQENEDFDKGFDETTKPGSKPEASADQGSGLAGEQGKEGSETGAAATGEDGKTGEEAGKKTGEEAGKAGKEADAEAGKAGKEASKAETDLEKRGAEMAEAKAEQTFWGELSSKMPDARKIAGTAEFKAWLKEQPSVVRQAANQNTNADDAVFVLKMYERQRAEAQAAASKAEEDPLGLKAFKIKGDAGEEIGWDKIKEDYGELALGMETLLLAQFKKFNEILAAQKSGTAQPQDLTDLRNSVAQLQFQLAVTEAHPDARKVVASEEFNTWMEKQPDTIKILYNEGTADDVVKVIDSYKEQVVKDSTGKTRKDQGARKGRLDSVHTSTARSGASQAGSDAKATAEADDDFEGGFNEEFKNRKAS